jgi:hypothetical protein
VAPLNSIRGEGEINIIKNIFLRASLALDFPAVFIMLDPA